MSEAKTTKKVELKGGDVAAVSATSRQYYISIRGYVTWLRSDSLVRPLVAMSLHYFGKPWGQIFTAGPCPIVDNRSKTSVLIKRLGNSPSVISLLRLIH